MTKHARQNPIVKEDGTVLVNLTQGYWTIVDLPDFEKYCRDTRWYYHEGYALRMDQKKPIQLHRLIAGTPDGFFTDHKNGCRLDNRVCNLKIVTGSQNCRNRKIHSNNTSTVIGVSWDKSKNRYATRVTVNGKMYNLGDYKLFHEAVAARKRGEDLYYHDSASYQNRPLYRELIDTIIATRCSAEDARLLYDEIFNETRMAA